MSKLRRFGGVRAASRNPERSEGSAIVRPASGVKGRLAFHVEVEPDGGAVLDDFLAVERHLELRDPRPFQAAQGLGGFGHGALGRLGADRESTPLNLRSNFI